MKDKFSDCVCHTVTPTHEILGLNQVMNDFEYVRSNCPALKEILIPDNIWLDYKKAVFEKMDRALHLPFSFNAFKNSELKRITSPIHRYLIENGKPKQQLQYNLKDHWMIKRKNEFERQEISKKYLGKLIELQCAEWIEEELGWKVSNLAALGGKSDIEAMSPENIAYVIEVKYRGIYDEMFESMLKSLSGEGGAFTLSPYTACDLILFAIYTAAKQLMKLSLTTSSIVFIVIDGWAWEIIKIPLRKKWIDQNNPGFFKKNQEIEDYLNKQKEKYPNIENDLKATLGCINQIWIIRENFYKYSLEETMEFKSK